MEEKTDSHWHALLLVVEVERVAEIPIGHVVLDDILRVDVERRDAEEAEEKKGPGPPDPHRNARR